MTFAVIDTISAAIRSGDFSEAERLCKTGLSAHDRDENLLSLLAISLHRQGKKTAATAVFARLTELFPDQSVHWGNYATILRETGGLQEAEDAYATAIRLDPRNVAPLINLGLLLIQRRDYLAARERLLDALDIDPELPLARIHGARACSLSQDFHGAEDLLKPWRQWLPLKDAALQVELANLLLLMGNASGAQELLEDLGRRNPSDLQVRLLLANVYERLNRLADVELLVQPLAGNDHLDQRTRREVDHVLATLALRHRDPDAARLLLERAGPREGRDQAHYFKLAEAFDKLGETGPALQALQTAHALQIEELKITNPEAIAAHAPPLPPAVPQVSASDYAQWPQLHAPNADHSPVFIVGFPRSGTTLLEQMLDAHPGLQSMDENPFFNRLADKLRRHDTRILGNLDVLQQLDCDELRKRYGVLVTEKVQRRWDAQLVDKNPLNMLWLPIIYRLFPNAKFILAVRHPCDVILSCYMQNFRSSILIAASASLEQLAKAYVAAMQTWLHHVQVFQPHVLVSRYEDLVADFPQQTGRIASFLKLDDAAPMMNFDQHARDKGYIATPSYSQVIEPVNRKGLDRWLRYRREFEPVLPLLEPMLRRWGYASTIPTE